MVGGGRLEVVEFDTESFAAVEILEEGVVRLLCFCGIFMREVYKVRAVRQDMTEF